MNHHALPALSAAASGGMLFANERRRAEEALVRVGVHLHLAAEFGGLGFWETDLTTGEFLSASPIFLGHLGLHSQAAWNVPEWAKAIHPEDQKLARGHFWDSGRTEMAEFRVRRAGGGERWLRSDAIVLSDETGRPERRAGITQDITPRKEAEADGREAAWQHRAILGEILASVTSGKFRLTEMEGDLPIPLAAAEPIPLTQTGGLRELRRQVREAAAALDFTDDRVDDLARRPRSAG